MVSNFGAAARDATFYTLVPRQGESKRESVNRGRRAAVRVLLFQKKESRRNQRRDWTDARAGREVRRGASGDRAKQHRGRGVWEGGKEKVGWDCFAPGVDNEKNWPSGFPCNFSPVPQNKSGVPWRRPAVSAATLPTRCVFCPLPDDEPLLMRLLRRLLGEALGIPLAVKKGHKYLGITVFTSAGGLRPIGSALSIRILVRDSHLPLATPGLSVDF